MRKTLLLSVIILVLYTVMSCDDSSHNVKNEVIKDVGAPIIIPTATRNHPVLVGNIPCSFPLVTDKTKMTILAAAYGEHQCDDIFVWKTYEEMTGVPIHWITVTYEAREEAIFTALMNKSKIDLILRGKITPSNIMQYGDSGLIINLMKDDLLRKNAPNCWSYLQSHPDTLASILNPDGSIYSLPQVNSGAELRVSRKILINNRWLHNVGIDVPKTTEDLYLLLKAFKEQDANGNGDPHDEIPLCSQDWFSLQDAFFGAFGLGNRGVHNQLVDCNEKTGSVRFIATSDGYKAFLEYIHRLYAENLLDNYIFTMTIKQWLTNAANDRIGIFANTNLATIPADKASDWIAVEHALTGPNGDSLWTAIRANFHSPGAAVIPASCTDPALALRWLDFFWTDEGTLFYHMGIENETFIAKPNGTYDYVMSIYKQITGEHSFDDIIAQYSPYPGGYNPTVEIAPYFMGGEMADVPARSARKLFAFGPREYWPNFTFTCEEFDILDLIQPDIEKYIRNSRIDFISGKKPFTEWDSYCAHLKELQIDTLLSIYQAAVDRYTKLKAVTR